VVEGDSADGLVRGVVQVRRARIHLVAARGGDGGVVAGLLVGQHVDLEVVTLGLGDGFGRPLAGVQEIHHVAGSGEVQRNAGELPAGPTLEEQDAVVLTDPHHLTQQRLGLGRARHERLAPVRHLHHRHPRTLPVQQLGAGLLQHLGREHGGAGGEVEDAHGPILAPGAGRPRPAPGCGTGQTDRSVALRAAMVAGCPSTWTSAASRRP